MIRPIAAFLALGFASIATFLLVPDEAPVTPRLDDGEARPLPLGLKGSLACAPARCAPPPGAARIDPRRFEEAVPKEELVLDVVREDGRPIANASLRFLNLGVALDAVTDPNGRARVEAQPGTSAFLTVTGADFYAHTDVVALEPGLRRIVVPNRRTVVARVLVRGQTPRDPIRIGYQLPMNVPRLSALSDAQGRVEFFNLPQGVDGTFTWPEGYRRDEQWGIAETFSSLPTAAELHPSSGAFYNSPLPTDAEWKTAERVAIAVGRALPMEAQWRTASLTWTNVKLDVAPTITLPAHVTGFPANVNFQVQASDASFMHWPRPVPPAEHPQAGPALVSGIVVQGCVEFARKVVAPDVAEIRLIPTRTLPIRILDPSGAAVAASVQVKEGWCAFGPGGIFSSLGSADQQAVGLTEGWSTLTLDEDVYAAGLASVIEVHWSPTGVVLPIENVSMTWNASGAPSATVTVGYPPSASEPVVVDVIDDQQK
jgi:hypothetical protein